MSAHAAAAVPSYVEKTLAQMKAALEPDRSSIRKIVLVPSPVHAEAAQLTARQVRKTLKDGKRILTVFLTPASVKGFAVLTWERPGQPDVEWVYLAPVHRLLKNADLGAMPFLYTEFTFRDLTAIKLGTTTLNLLGAEQLAEKRTFKVREVPRLPRPYAYRLTWIATDSYLPLKREYYDAADTLVKTELFADVDTVDGTPTPLRVRIEDKREGRYSELLVSELHYDAQVPDALFNPAKFLTVADNPFWQSVGH